MAPKLAEMNVSIRNAAIAAIAVLMLGVLLLVTPPPGGLWLRTLYDASHVPLFGAVAIAILLTTPSRWGGWRRFGSSVAGVALLGALSELAQVPTARDASLADLSADLFGGVGFLCIALGCGVGGSVRRIYRPLLVLLGLAAVAVPLVPLANVSAGYIQRQHALPRLIRFDSRHATLFFGLRNAALTLVPAQAPAGSATGAGRVSRSTTSGRTGPVTRRWRSMSRIRRTPNF